MSTTTLTPVRQPSPTRLALRWMVSFVGFPLGGLAALLVIGAVDSQTTALLGGALTGAVLGAVQAWALRLDRSTARAWVGATAAGLAIGLALGSGLVDYATGAGDLAVQGFASGALVGVAQAVVLGRRTGALAAVWPAYLAGAWALGWTVTRAGGIQVEDQFTVFGAYGAITVAALTNVLPVVLARSTNN